MARTDEARVKGEDFLKYAADAEQMGVRLEESLRAGDAEAAGRAYRGLKKNCDACHSQYRD
jgi:cytochrome c556